MGHRADNMGSKDEGNGALEHWSIGAALEEEMSGWALRMDDTADGQLNGCGGLSHQIARLQGCQIDQMANDG